MRFVLELESYNENKLKNVVRKLRRNGFVIKKGIQYHVEIIDLSHLIKLHDVVGSIIMHDGFVEVLSNDDFGSLVLSIK